MDRFGYWTTTIVALVTASCCVLPLMLLLLGGGVAWMTLLSPFVEYRVPILIAVTLVLGAVFFHMKRRRRGDGGGRVVLTPAGMVAIGSLALAWSSPLWEDAAVEQLLALLHRSG